MFLDMFFQTKLFSVALPSFCVFSCSLCVSE